MTSSSTQACLRTESPFRTAALSLKGCRIPSLAESPVRRRTVSDWVESERTCTNRFENGFVVLVANTVTEREIERVVLALPYSYVLSSCLLGIVMYRRGGPYPNFSRAREIFAVLMEADSHNPVSGVERFLHPITMMYVDVDVQHAVVISVCMYLVSVVLCSWSSLHRPEKLQNPKDNV